MIADRPCPAPGRQRLPERLPAQIEICRLDIFERYALLHRLALHASELRVPHPTLGDVLIRAPVTADLAGPLVDMGLLPHDR